MGTGKQQYERARRLGLALVAAILKGHYVASTGGSLYSLTKVYERASTLARAPARITSQSKIAKDEEHHG